LEKFSAILGKQITYKPKPKEVDTTAEGYRVYGMRVIVIDRFRPLIHKKLGYAVYAGKRNKFKVWLDEAVNNKNCFYLDRNELRILEKDATNT
jgi:hypothetical protein